MALEPLGKRPEVLRTYQVMEQNNLYREKVEHREAIEQIDKLTRAIEDMEKKVKELYKQAGVLDGSLVYAAFYPLERPKSIVRYVREQLLETVGKAANAGHGELLTAFNTPPVPSWVKIVQDALHEEEGKMKTAEQILDRGKDEFQDKLKGAVESMGSTLEQLGKDTDKLMEQSIAAAKARGVRFNMPEKPVLDNFVEIVQKWGRKDLATQDALRLCNMSRATFYRKIRENETTRMVHCKKWVFQGKLFETPKVLSDFTTNQLQS